MKKLNLFVAIFLCCVWANNVQAQAPGGVLNPSIWIHTVNTEASTTLWDNNKNEPLFSQSKHKKQLNFNPSFQIDAEKDPLRIQLDQQLDFAKATVFVVYHSPDTTEQTVWNFSSNNKTTLILSTHRMADLKTIKYMNFPHLQKGKATIHSFIQRDEIHRDSVSKKEIVLGAIGHTHQLPLSSMNGSISEFIVYNRVLTSIERNQVASYLSLKYGISLSLNKDQQYINSNKKILWDNAKSEEYIHSVTGIAIDSLSQLKQTKSTNANDGQLIIIQKSENSNFNNNENTNNEFFLWGDNNKVLGWNSSSINEGILLQRKWLAKAISSNNNFPVDLIFKQSLLPKLPSAEHHYYLVIDQTAMGSFPSEFVATHPVDSLDDNGNIYFKNINWSVGELGKAIFTIGTTPNTLTDSTSWITTEELTQNELLDFEIFPNPVAKGSSFNIQFKTNSTEPIQLIIRNIHGQVITSSSILGINNYKHFLDTPGMYFISLSNSKKQLTKKIIIQ